jgi:hypothetical protein
VPSDGDYCRAQAAECARSAESAGTKEAKARFLNLERRWLEHAAKADKYYLAVNRQRARSIRATADELVGNWSDQS